MTRGLPLAIFGCRGSSNMSDRKVEGWRPIRRGATRLRLDANNVWFEQSAHTFEFLTDQLFHLRADLDGNLATKGKARAADKKNARMLADGGMKDLRRLQIGDRRLAGAILDAARRCGQMRGPWTVTLRSGGDWAFLAQPQGSAEMLVLRVSSQPGIVRHRPAAVRVSKEVKPADAGPSRAYPRAAVAGA